MTLNNGLKKVLWFIPVLTTLNCSSPSGPVQENVLNITETPTITGFYVTTNDHPDGTGEVIGNPSYVVNQINVFPNPYYDTTFEERVFGGFDRIVRFTHLPAAATIVVVKGKSEQEALSSSRSFLGIPIFHTGAAIVRTIVKNNDLSYCSWDLKDEKGNYVSSGCYRAYITFEQNSDYCWLDISLNLLENDLPIY